MQTAVKKWFREKDSGYLDNSGGPEIIVRKADLIDCQFLKAGVIVEFECHIEKEGLIARKVRLAKQKKPGGKKGGEHGGKPFRFGVMT